MTPVVAKDASIHEALIELIEDSFLDEVVMCLDMIAQDRGEGRVVMVQRFVYPDVFNGQLPEGSD